MYKTLGFKWLFGTFCPAPAFLTADSDEARNPQRFIHVTVIKHKNYSTTHLLNPLTFQDHIMFPPYFYGIVLTP